MRRNRKTRTTTVKGTHRDEFYKYEIEIISTGEHKLDAGTHEWPFQWMIPASHPSSMAKSKQGMGDYESFYVCV